MNRRSGNEQIKGTCDCMKDRHGGWPRSEKLVEDKRTAEPECSVVYSAVRSQVPSTSPDENDGRYGTCLVTVALKSTLFTVIQFTVAKSSSSKRLNAFFVLRKPFHHLLASRHCIFTLSRCSCCCLRHTQRSLSLYPTLLLSSYFNPTSILQCPCWVNCELRVST